MDPRYRLNRTILGESILVPRSFSERFNRSEIVKPCQVKIRESKQLSEHKVRATRRLVETAPNAPKLIRLVRHPYTQEVTRPKAGEPWRHSHRLDRSRESYRTEFRKALSESRRPAWPRVTRETRLLETRTRISVDDWLKGAGE